MPKTASHPRFYLKQPKSPSEDGTSLILMQYKYDKNRLIYSTGKKIKLSRWNKDDQRAKGNAGDEKKLNDYLAKLKSVAYEACYVAGTDNVAPTPSELKNKLDASVRNITAPGKTTLFSLIDRFISGEIKAKGQDRAKKSLDSYKYFKRHLEMYQTAKKVSLDFRSITLDFFYSFTHYLSKDLELKRNTIAKNISLLKAVMNVAIFLPGNLVKQLDFQNELFTYTEEEVDNVYLDEKTVHKLAAHDFSQNKRLEQVRDLFVFGCCTGLRFSDYSNVQPENIKQIDGDTYISMITQKTKERVIIPCNPIVNAIFARYDHNANRLPKALSNQKFNTYIKEVCKAVELKETGKLIDKPELPLYECISSHTARRSFATNLYLDGFPTYEIMKITGHKTEKAFLKYIKVSKLDAARRLNEHIKKNWSAKILKVA